MVNSVSTVAPVQIFIIFLAKHAQLAAVLSALNTAPLGDMTAMVWILVGISQPFTLLKVMVIASTIILFSVLSMSRQTPDNMERSSITQTTIMLDFNLKEGVLW